VAYGYFGSSGGGANTPMFGDLNNSQLDGQWKQLIPGQAGGTVGWTGPTAAKAGGGGSGGAKQQQIDTKQTTYDPWSKYRGLAGDKLSQDMDSANDPSNFYRERLQQMSEPGAEFQTSDPSYNFRFKQGLQANARSLGARGLLNSGNAAAELQEYGQQSASQEYGAQFNRMLQGLEGVSNQYNQQQTRLMAMAGINLDPTSGARLSIAQQEANTGAAAVDNNYALGLASNAARSSNNTGGGVLGATPGSSNGVSWSAYFAAQNANSAAQTAAGVTSLGNPLVSQMWSV
jgi:hypothetical protein